MDPLKTFPASYLNTITFPLSIFQFIGIDFLDDPKTYVRNRCKLLLFIICFLTFFTSQILFLVRVNETGSTFINVANAIPCLFLMVMDTTKLIALLRKKHLVRSVILDIAELWPGEFEDELKNNIKKESLRAFKKFAGIIFAMTVMGVITYIWLPVFFYFITSLTDDDAPYLFPFQLYYPIKVDSLRKYLLVYLVQSLVGTVIHICVFYASDILLYILTSDICVMLRMLEYDLMNLKVERERPERSVPALKHIVVTHQKLMRLPENLNEIFGVIMLAVIVFSSVVLCFFGFLAIVARTKHQMFINATTFAGMGFIVFYTSLPGQLLAKSNFADAAYASPWYDGNLEIRKIIYIIIARSQKPCTLRAMGYADMNFATFSKICSTAWSYLSLVNQMYQNVEFEF